jgi:hypothetical protein
LPFAAVVFGKDWRSTVDPDLLCFSRHGTTGGTAKFVGMNCRFGPAGRSGSKGIHAAILVALSSIIDGGKKERRAICPSTLNKSSLDADSSLI